jgi:DNA-directed RNA polymerase subunit RPC12/RpoP
MQNEKLWKCSTCGNRTPRHEATTADQLGPCPHCKARTWLATDLEHERPALPAEGGKPCVDCRLGNLAP